MAPINGTINQVKSKKFIIFIAYFSRKKLILDNNMKAGHSSGVMVMFQEIPTIIAGYERLRTHQIVENFVPTNLTRNRVWEFGAKYPL